MCFKVLQSSPLQHSTLLLEIVFQVCESCDTRNPLKTIQRHVLSMELLVTENRRVNCYLEKQKDPANEGL